MKQYLIAVALLRPALGALSLCSTQNTGAMSSSSQYMSNGLCHDTCAGYTFAVVNGQECYCSNTQPETTVQLSECSAACPGYPSEQCAGSGFYGYIQLKDVGSTTTATTSPGTTSTSPQEKTTTSTTSPNTLITLTSRTPTTSTTQTSTSAVSTISTAQAVSAAQPTSVTLTTPTSLTTQTTSTTPTSTPTSTSTSTPTTSTTQTSASTTQTSSSTTPSTSTAQTTSAPTQPTSQFIVTSFITSVATRLSQQTEVITTQTTLVISSTSIPDSQATATESAQNDNNGFFQSTGKVAGVFAAVGVVVFCLVATILYCCCCRKPTTHDNDSDSEDVERFIVGYPNTTKGSLDPNDSSDDTVVGDKKHKRQVSLQSTDFGIPIIDRKGDSTYVDQRLDVGRFDEKEEVTSLNDGEDYSRRVLTVMNP